MLSNNGPLTESMLGMSKQPILNNAEQTFGSQYGETMRDGSASKRVESEKVDPILNLKEIKDKLHKSKQISDNIK